MNNNEIKAETEAKQSDAAALLPSAPLVANPMLAAVWNEWMSTYPKKNGLYIVVMRKTKEVWVAYWNDTMRRFEEACPNFTDKGVDVDFWAEFPVAPNGSLRENETVRSCDRICDLCGGKVDKEDNFIDEEHCENCGWS